MDKKDSPRVAMTKQLIKESLLQLLHTKHIHKISIRELCERAGVNRSTFYNHYGSQYDVFEEIAQDYLRNVTINPTDVWDEQSAYQRVVSGMQYVADHVEMSRMLINNSIDATFSDHLLSLLQIEKTMEMAFTEDSDPVEKKAIMCFAIHGSYELMREWINMDDRISAEELAKLMLMLVGRSCCWDDKKLQDKLFS